MIEQRAMEIVTAPDSDLSSSGNSHLDFRKHFFKTKKVVKFWIEIAETIFGGYQEEK